MKRLFCMTGAFVAVILLTFALTGCSSAPESEDFTFAVISDVHVPGYSFPIGMTLDHEHLMTMHNQKRLAAFTDELLSLQTRPDLVMNDGDTGDCGWKTLLKLYTKLMRPLVDAGIPIYTVVGNHDHDYAGIGREDLAEFFDPLGPAMIGRSGSRYSFDHKGCHFIVMNNRPVSGLIRFNPKDISWLADDLTSVDKNTRVLLFLHANMADEDTHDIVELLQPFSRPTIFYGHSHTSGMKRWGGVPVINTGSLYGGNPEAGSYDIVTVTADSITVRTRDFASEEAVFSAPVAVVWQEPATALEIEGENVIILNTGDTLAVSARGSNGTLEYKILGAVNEWTAAEAAGGNWSVAIPETEIPGRYFLALRFTSENGTITLGHRDIEIPGGPVEKLWITDLGSGVQSAPVISGNTGIIATIENGIHAFDLASGNELWHRDMPEGQIIGRMALAGSIVFAAAGRTVKALDTANGDILWETKLDGTVIAGITSCSDCIYIPSGENGLVCLDAATGKERWHYSMERPIIMEVATDGKHVCFGAMDGCIHCLDAATGKTLWKRQHAPLEMKYTTAPFWPPVIAGNRLVFGKNPADKEEKNLVALNLANGDLVWSRTITAGRFRTTLDNTGKRVYLAGRDNDTYGTYCISVADGDILWHSGTGLHMNARIACVDCVICRDAFYLNCLDTKDGSERWRYRTNTGLQGSYYGPSAYAVSGNTAFVGTMNGYVMALKW